MNVQDFRQLPLLGILRGVGPQVIEPLAEAVIESGLQTIEITMNTCDAPSLIQRMKNAAGSGLAVGAGTVLSLDDMHAALDAGASFIVMPVLVNEVMEYCVKNSVPVFPGALTPQEIYAAHAAGASMVKVFPSRFFGPSYFKEIKAPLDKVELLACGGVNEKTIEEFFRNGASAVAFGASVFKPELLADKRFGEIKTAVQFLISAYKKIKD